LKKFKSFPTLSDDVHAAVIVALSDRQDFCGAAYVGQTAFLRANDPKELFLLDALADHFLVARFENMQRQRCAGEQHEIQRE